MGDSRERRTRRSWDRARSHGVMTALEATGRTRSGSVMEHRSLAAFLAGSEGAGGLGVLGIHLGDPASRLTAVSPSSADPRGIDGQAAQALSLAERVALTVRNGGWIRASGFSFRVSDARVQEITIRGGSLRSLDLNDEAALTALLGPARSRLGARGRVTLHYPERFLRVGVTVRPFSLEHILLGSTLEPTGGRFRLMFGGGFPARLVSVRMHDVYAGLLEGLPTREGNQEIIDHQLAQAKRELSPSPVTLIPPTQRAIPRDRPYPFGTPARLPSVVCSGLFRSRYCAQDELLDHSDLGVVWFQERMELPPAPDQFEGLDWRAHARDYSH